MRVEELKDPIDRLSSLVSDPQLGLSSWQQIFWGVIEEVFLLLSNIRSGDKKVWITGLHPYAFRAGESAQIIGVSMETPEGQDPRPCFEIRFEDGGKDFVPISDLGNYQLTDVSVQSSAT